jgi:CheY-like chemotaxis protein
MMTAQSEVLQKLILVIDDDTDSREALCDLLELLGYEVGSAENGLEGLRYLSREQPLPSLILLDLYMPVMDGWEFMRQLHGNPGTADLPVIVLSAADRPAAEEAEAVLQKPVNVLELMDTVARFVRPRPKFVFCSCRSAPA